jgi:tRNA dimethylallyltransferase
MKSEKTIPVIFVMGPTAAGKTSLSLELASVYGGEIISSDSMQIYEGFTIGTAKATEEERGIIPHHLLDMVPPNGSYSVAKYQEDALNIIKEIQAKKSLPVLVGGTGLYTQSLLYQLDFSKSRPDDQLREHLESDSTEVLFEKLMKLDPQARDQIHPNNRKRVIRALEILASRDKRSTGAFRTPREDFPSLLIGVNFRDRQKLYDRINRRVDIMVESGWIQEVKDLLAAGVSRKAQAFQAIGYPEILQVIEGTMTLEAAKEKIKQSSRRYAKRQLTWYRKETNIHWFYWEDYEEKPEELFRAVHAWIEEQIPALSREADR